LGSLAAASPLAVVGKEGKARRILAKVLLLQDGGGCNGQRDRCGPAQGACRDETGDGQEAVG